MEFKADPLAESFASLQQGEGVSDAPVRLDDARRNLIEFNRFLGTAPAGRNHKYNAIQHGGQQNIVRYNLFRDNLGGGVNYVGDRHANLANTVVLPEYVTADAMAWARLGKFKAQLNIRNIFDRDYIVSAHGTVGNLNMPGAPRSVMFTLRYAID